MSTARKSYAGILLVQTRRSYGLARTYPANEAAKKLTTWCGKRTLSHEDLLALEALGYLIEWLPEGEPEPKEKV